MIVVCGEALVDVVDGVERPGGGSFNTARALGRLGAPVAFLGHLSTDAAGQRLAALLAEDGVSLELASFGEEPTTRAVASVDAGGGASYRFQVEGTSAPQLTSWRLPDQVDALWVGSLGLVLEPMASTLLSLVRREGAGRLLMLDPNVRPGLVPDDAYRARLLEVVGLSTVVKASDADLAWLCPGRDALETLLAAGVRLAIATLGAGGALARHGDFSVAVNAVPIEVADTIGAGDAFGGALLAWLHDHGALAPSLELSRDELADALRYACRAAATILSS